MFLGSTNAIELVSKVTKFNFLSKNSKIQNGCPKNYVFNFSAINHPKYMVLMSIWMFLGSTNAIEHISKVTKFNFLSKNRKIQNGRQYFFYFFIIWLKISRKSLSWCLFWLFWGWQMQYNSYLRSKKSTSCTNITKFKMVV